MEQPRLDTRTIAIANAKIFPGNDEVTIGQSRDGRIVLRSLGRRIDQELTGHRGAVGLEHPRLDGLLGPIAASPVRIARILPSYYEVAVGEYGDLGQSLMAIDQCIDPEFGAGLGAVGVEALSPDLGEVAARVASVRPGNH